MSRGPYLGRSKGLCSQGRKLAFAFLFPKIAGGYKNSSWLESGLKVRKSQAMLFFENLSEPKMDVIDQFRFLGKN